MHIMCISIMFRKTLIKLTPIYMSCVMKNPSFAEFLHQISCVLTVQLTLYSPVCVRPSRIPRGQVYRLRGCGDLNVAANMIVLNVYVFL